MFGHYLNSSKWDKTSSDWDSRGLKSLKKYVSASNLWGFYEEICNFIPAYKTRKS